MKIDHVAINVDDITKAVEWYLNYIDGEILYQDDTWAFIKTDTIKLALTLKRQHPPHIALEVTDELSEEHKGKKFKKHRDGTKSYYQKDPWGNFIEMIVYPKTNCP